MTWTVFFAACSSLGCVVGVRAAGDRGLRGGAGDGAAERQAHGGPVHPVRPAGGGAARHVSSSDSCATLRAIFNSFL